MRKLYCPFSPPLTQKVANDLKNGPGFFSPARKCFITFDQKHQESARHMNLIDKLQPALRARVYEIGNAALRIANNPKPGKKARNTKTTVTLEDLGL